MALAETWVVFEGRIRVRRAAKGELPVVAHLLEEVSAWLESRGQLGWLRPFPVATLEATLALGPTFLAWDGEAAAGTFALHQTDVRFWGERPAESPGHARYLHKLAVRRGYAGLGRELVALAERLAREGGADRLRLDCRADSPGIRSYYESAGFEYRGEIGGPGFDTVYALYEKSLE
jgi:ribosomal protein S18 acetylase RimI-like enzyme